MLIEAYELTAKGKAIVKKLDKEYLKAWKEGYTDNQAMEIAIARVVQSE